MEDHPNGFGAEIHAFFFDSPDTLWPLSVGYERLHAWLDAASERLSLTVFLVSTSGDILMSAGEDRFGTTRDIAQRRWQALWPTESRQLAQEALLIAVRELREVAIEVARIADGRSAQNWEARIAPLPVSGLPRVSQGADRDPLLLVSLRDITSETRVRRLKGARP